MVTISVVADGKAHLVEITMAGQPMKPRGPYRDRHEAEAAAAKIASICRTFGWPVVQSAQEVM